MGVGGCGSRAFLCLNFFIKKIEWQKIPSIEKPSSLGGNAFKYKEEIILKCTRMERTKPIEETKSHFQGSSLHFPTLFRLTSMYPILFSFSRWKMKIFHQLSTKSCPDGEDRKVTNDLDHTFIGISRSSCVAANAIHPSIFVHFSNIHLFI